MASLFSMAMKVTPGSLRAKAAFKIACAALARVAGTPPKVKYEKDKIVFRFYNCPSCEGIQSDQPMCFYDVGVLKALAEFGTGKAQRVTEIECAAMGAEACVFEIREA